MSERLRIIAIGGIVGGAFVAIGALLPWVSGTAYILEISRTGVQLGGDGTLALIAGMLLVLLWCAVLFLEPVREHDAPRVIALLAGIGIVYLGIVDLGDLQDRVNTVTAAGATATVGAGIYVVMLGGVLTAGLAAVLLFSKKSTSKTTGPPPKRPDDQPAPPGGY